MGYFNGIISSNRYNTAFVAEYYNTFQYGYLSLFQPYNNLFLNTSYNRYDYTEPYTLAINYEPLYFNNKYTYRKVFDKDKAINYTYKPVFGNKKTTQVKPSSENVPVSNGTQRPPAGRKLGKDFLEAVKDVAQRLNCDYKDLLAIMNAESGLNPAAVNKLGGATGLIQFMPKTAERLGTTTQQLKNMSAMEQLPYVEEFLKRCKKMAGFKPDERLTGGDLYALVFLPARAKREILCEKGEGNNFYEHNAGTDVNKDEKITKFDLQERLLKKRVDETIFV